MLKRKAAERPLLVACDIYRPAAIKQLQVVGEQAGRARVRARHAGPRPHRGGGREARASNTATTTVILDTAGRLHVDEELMERAEAHPGDAVAADRDSARCRFDDRPGRGQRRAEAFNDLLDITGVILTKLDGDTRGGAALSVRARHRQADQVCRRGREAGRHGAVPPRPDGLPHSRAWGTCSPSSRRPSRRLTRRRPPSWSGNSASRALRSGDYLEQFRQIK